MTIERRWLKASEGAEYLGTHRKSICRVCSELTPPHANVPGVGIRTDKQGLDEVLARGDAELERKLRK